MTSDSGDEPRLTGPLALVARPLTRKAFAPFGEVIEAGAAARHFTINAGNTERYHDLARLDPGPQGRAIVSIFRGQPRTLPFDVTMMERHPLASQAFVPLSGRRWLVVVAPAGAPPQAEDLACFVARGDQGVNYAAGVWHHPLLALDAPSDFLVIDRVGPGDNCDEIPLARAARIELQEAERQSDAPARVHFAPAMSALDSKIPPPLVGLAVAALMWSATRLAPAFGFELPARGAIAVLFVIAGAFADLAGLVSFRRARTTVNPLRPQSSSALVTSGIYRFTRNPMYLGMLSILVGWGIWLSNALALALSAVFVAWMNRFQIAPEERALSALFGRDFADYTQRVRRWL